ncbi:MAG: nuoJ [Phycisphaerales bacterium]|nr:nuoJ [Phycisphaerales bacterium]
MTMPPGALPFAPIAATLAAAGDAATPQAAGPAALAPLIPPALILLLCAAAGIGTVLLLPGRRDGAIRKVGGAVLLVAGLVFGAVVFRAAAGRADEVGANLFFWPFAAVGLFAAVRVVTHPRPVYSALYFVLATFASAGLFVLVWAEFMAAALILIYAGAILVTYVFVIMLATQSTAAAGSGATAVNDYDTVSREPVVAAAIGFAMMALLIFVVSDKATPIARVPEAGPTADHIARNESTQAMGRHLFEHHLLNLEVAGLLLTLATVGAIVIARRPGLVVTDAFGNAVAAAPDDVVVGPATPTDDDPHSIPVYGTDNPRQKAYPET